MKKLLIIGLVLALVALGASVMTGRIFHERLVDIEAKINKDPRLEAVNTTENKGLLSSSGTLTVAMYLEDKQRLIIESPWQASHFPGWVNYAGKTQLLLEMDEKEIFDLLDELGMEALAYQGKAGWKEASFQMLVQPFVFEDAYSKIEVASIDLTGSYNYSDLQTGNLIAKQVRFLEKSRARTQLELDNLALSWNQRGHYPWVEGDAKLTLERAYFLSSQGEIELINPSLTQQLAFNKQSFDYLIDLNLGKVKSQGENLGTGKLTLKTLDFNGQAMASLIEASASRTAIEQTENKDEQAINSALDQLLGGSPTLVLQALNFDLQLPFKFEQQATGRLSFDGTNLPLNYLQQLEEGRLASEDATNRIRLELNLSKLEPALLLMAGIPTSFLDLDSEEQKLVFEAGELKLNGHLIPF